MMEYEDEREAVLMMTEACNSNCIMCPMSSDARKRGNRLSEKEAEEELSHLCEDTEHIDITGGEPFLNAPLVLDVMKRLNEQHAQIPVQILTNGRALSLPSIQKAIAQLITSRYRFAIPIHAGNAALHDNITQTPGSLNRRCVADFFVVNACADRDSYRGASAEYGSFG